ncbi:amidohydrolase [Streptomyces sp. NPDC102360]|uniref:amidohydrolase n=1 Tax=Streptomyces sp. NPDC102360 TaxID=3366160 RepID=UPI003827E2F4
MSTAEELKARVCAAIDRAADRITGLSDDILRHPETGYKETRTAGVVADQFTALGLTPQTGLAHTGVKARMRGRAAGPTVAVLGELDSLIIPEHPFADPDTGAAHACGHNAQIAAMVGVGIGMSEVVGELDGDVVLFAVPAEECIEVDWRMGLRDKGELHHTAGKAELIRGGHFDDVDMAMLTHAGPSFMPVAVGGAGNGSLVKRIRFLGKASHAGAAPWDGISAYKAATVAIAAIDAHREMMREDDGVRVHHLITHSGDAVTAIPARTDMEMLIRARTVEGMKRASDLVDRALRGGALAMGADVHISTAVSFMPYVDDAPLAEALVPNAQSLAGDGFHRIPTSGPGGGGSTDMGDLKQVMPVVQPFASAGQDASLHSNGFYTKDQVAAAIVPAKFMAMTVVDLLMDGASAAHKVIEASGPKLTREQFVKLHDSLSSEEDFSGGVL